MKSKSPKPYSKGRTVMYVPNDEDFEVAGGNRDTAPWPATIVQTWENTGYQNDEVNLKVLTDGPKDLWRTSVPYDGSKAPGTWHWPEINN